LVPKLKDGVPGEAKTRFWNAVFGAAAARLHEPFLLVGDLNTGAHRVDETGKTFVCAEHFGKLSASGWTDMWRHHNPGATEWTRYSKLNGGARGNGFRLDHEFATPSPAPRITSCRYSHVEREAGTSDHSMHCGSGVTVRTRNQSTIFVALDEQWLSLLKVGVGLNPNLQITGAVMADIGHVFCKARFQRYCCLVNLDIGKNLAVLRVNLNARKILQSAERYVILQLLDLHIIASAVKNPFSNSYRSRTSALA
jgi:hypothetical protein